MKARRTPAVAVKASTPKEKPKKGGNGGNGGSGDLHLDPLLMALLRKIPQAGSDWPAENRLRWFRAFATNVSQVYDDDEPIELEITIKKRGQEPVA